MKNFFTFSTLMWLICACASAQVGTQLIGSSGNAFSYGVIPIQHQLISLNGVGTNGGSLGLIYRRNPTLGSSGAFMYAVSTDGGTTWATQKGPVNPLLTNAGRYPAMTLFSHTTGSTNTADLRMAYSGAVLNASNVWNGQVRGVVSNLPTTPTVTQEIYAGSGGTTVPYAPFMANRVNGEVWSVSNMLDVSNTANQFQVPVFPVYKGVYDANTQQITWTLNTTLTPPIATVGGTANAYSNAKIAFSPDGSVGYVVLMGDMVGGRDSMFHPILYKYTTATNTWSAPMAVELGQFANETAYIASYGANNGEMTCLTNSFDLTVDMNNNPHILASIVPAAISAGAYYIYTGFAKALYDITIDPSNDWNMIYLGDRVAYNEVLGTAPNTVSFQAASLISRSEDGSQIFYHWNDTDTSTTSAKNNAPNLYGRILNVSTQSISPTQDWTTGTALANLMRVPKAAPIALKVPGSTCTYNVPITRLKFGATMDPNTAVEYHFTSGIQYDCASATDPIFWTEPSGYDVTFQVDMNTQTIGANGARIMGDFQVAAGYAANWDPNATEVVNVGGSIYNVTVNIPAGTYEYKFLKDSVLGSEESIPAACQVNGNRGVTINSDSMLSLVCFAQCSTCCTLSAAAGAITNVSCFGGNNGTATMNHTGGGTNLTYSWSNGQTTQTATNLAAGTYTCYLSDGICTQSASFTITQPNAITPNTTVTNVSCFGGNNGTATANVTGGTGAYTYQWSPSGGTTATATGLTAGNYTCTITDANNCTSSVSANITQPTQLSATPSNTTNVSCFGGNNGAATVSATGGTGTYAYMWSPSGGNAATATALTSGNYTCMVMDANNCMTNVNVTITQPATALTASVTAQTNVACGSSNGSATVTATGGTGAYTYMWSPSGGNAATATGLSAGAYTCMVMDANNCMTNVPVSITQPTAINVTNAGQANVSCFGGSNGSATVNATGGVPSYTYSWAPSGGTSATATGLTAGNYTCYVSDINNCPAFYTFTITEPSALTSNANATTILCNGGTATVTVAATGGTAPYTGTGTFTVPAGSYTYNITDVNGCVSTTNLNVTEPAALASTATATAILCNGGNSVVTLTATGGTAPYTGTGSFTVAAGTYNYNVTDANGCLSTTNVSISQPTALTANAAATNILCNGGNSTVTVTATGGTSPYNGTGSFTVNAGTYTYNIADANGCTTTTNATVSEPSAITVSVNASTIACNGGNATVMVAATGGTAPYTGIGTFVVPAGVYNYTVTDANGCASTANQTITQPAALSLTTYATPSTGTNGTASVAVTGGTGSIYTYLWNTGATVASISNLAPGTYCVTVTDANACTSSACVTVEIYIGVENAIVLNQLTVMPNPSDGLYSLQFELKEAQTCTISIFDVNGKLVYTENTDKIVKYENKLNLQSQAQGVYFLQIRTMQGNANLKLIKE